MELRGSQRVRHCGKREGWKVRVRGLPAIMSPQTACTAGDRPALMNKVTNFLGRDRAVRKRRRDNWQ